MTPLLIFVFVFILIVTLGIVLFVSRPTQDEKAVDKRLYAIKTRQGEFAAVGDSLDLQLKAKEQDSFRWLANLFEDSGHTGKLRMLILQADRSTSVGKVLMTCMGLGLCGFLGVLLLTGGKWYFAAPALLAGAFPMMLLQFQRARRLKAFEKVLADCIDTMGRSLRAGHSVVAAIGIVAEQAPAPANTEFGEVYKKQNYGLPLRDAFMQMLDRVPSQDLRVLVTGILVQKDTGGNLAEILDRITEVIRERVRIKGEIRTHTAQGRMTGYILCALPVVMLVLINMVNPGYSNVLFNDPSGQKLLALGIGLLCLGGLVIRQIIRGIEI